MPCRAHLSQLRERQVYLAGKNIKVVVVSFEAGFTAVRYIEDTGIDWPLLVDETRELYRSYGMLQAGFWDIWGVPPGRPMPKNSCEVNGRKNSRGIFTSAAVMF
ncbi:MAG: peroxiredoxin family protein [Proteobacteria bacterium]|nr:peroxiredoxin family protein [Pseudomonadota bacterium]MBU1687574.1 peroxiredoxin family protein [Pseudomonadota bacterium]